MRMLIADDDDYTREGLMDAVEWSQYGIEEIIEARDGAQALRLAAQHKPEIVLTDIRMPKLNGIAFAEKLGEQCPDCKLLFMSGYLDVEYLKSAIRLAAVDYIEKPIKIPDLKEAIAKTVESVQKSRRLTDELSIKKNLQQQKLAQVLIEGTAGREAVLKQCEEAGFPVNAGYVCVIVSIAGQSGGEPELLEELHAFWHRQGVQAVGNITGRGELGFVLPLNRVKLERVHALAKQVLISHDSLSIATGSRVADMFEVSQSYMHARTALNCFFYEPEARFSPYAEPESTSAGISPQLFVDFYMLMKSQPRELTGWIEALCDRLVSEERPPREQVYSLFSSMGKAMLQEKGALLAGLDGVYEMKDIDTRISAFYTLSELKEYMLAICSSYCAEKAKEAEYSHTVISVMDYVAAHVSKAELDLPEIGQHMFMSSAHLNVLFKQETGMTITQYIRDYRIELAKKLIMNEHYKMNAISELCGFASPSYFAKVFRLCTSVTPVEYRKLKLR